MLHVGIDLGGTGITAAALSETYEILARTDLPTRPERPYQEVVRDMASAARRALEDAGARVEDADRIGIGVPGSVDPVSGIVGLSGNLGWNGVPLRDEMARYFSVPVLMDNDANAAALGESVLGASRDTGSSVLITIGTGIGAGMIVHGRPWGGAFGMAGEIGHLTMVPDGVPCACGRCGCVEQYCSATALVRMARSAYMTFRPRSGYVDRAVGNGPAVGNAEPWGLTARDVIDAARAGDEAALQVFRQYARYVALMVDDVFNFFDPEIVVLGGGVSRAGDFLLETVRAYLPQTEMGAPRPPYRLELARLGSDAGVIGAAMLGGLP